MKWTEAFKDHSTSMIGVYAIIGSDAVAVPPPALKDHQCFQNDGSHITYLGIVL